MGNQFQRENFYRAFEFVKVDDDLLLEFWKIHIKIMKALILPKIYLNILRIILTFIKKYIIMRS